MISTAESWRRHSLLEKWHIHRQYYYYFFLPVQGGRRGERRDAEREREKERDGGVDSFASSRLVFTWVFPSADKRFGEPRLPLSVNICLTIYPILHCWLVARCMLGKFLLSLPPCHMTPHQTTALKCSIYRLNRWQKYFKMTKIALSAVKTEKQLK